MTPVVHRAEGKREVGIEEREGGSGKREEQDPVGRMSRPPIKRSGDVPVAGFTGVRSPRSEVRQQKAHGCRSATCRVVGALPSWRQVPVLATPAPPGSRGAQLCAPATEMLEFG